MLSVKASARIGTFFSTAGGSRVSTAVLGSTAPSRQRVSRYWLTISLEEGDHRRDEGHSSGAGESPAGEGGRPAGLGGKGRDEHTSQQSEREDRAAHEAGDVDGTEVSLGLDRDLAGDAEGGRRS